VSKSQDTTEKPKRQPEAELEKLIADQLRDAAGHQPRARHHADVDDTQLSDQAPMLGDVAHRDEPLGGRIKKPRAGTRRLTFHDHADPDGPGVVLDVSTFGTEVGTVDASGVHVPEPGDWAAVAASAIAGAKLTLLSYTNRIRSMTEIERQREPDPRGPKLRAEETLRTAETGGRRP